LDAPASLVFTRDGEAVTTTLAIAEGTGNPHASVIKLTRRYVEDLTDFGSVGFEIQANRHIGRGGGDAEYALLTEPQATFLLTLMRNSPVVVAFKKALVKAFFELRSARREALAPRADGAALLALSHEIGEMRNLVARQGETIVKLYDRVDEARKGHIHALDFVIRVKEKAEKAQVKPLSEWEFTEARKRLVVACACHASGKAGVAAILQCSRPILARVLSPNDPTPLSQKLARKVLERLPGAAAMLARAEAAQREADRAARQG
jgi:phage regulator Rha-like protein